MSIRVHQRSDGTWGKCVARDTDSCPLGGEHLDVKDSAELQALNEATLAKEYEETDTLSKSDSKQKFKKDYLGLKASDREFLREVFANDSFLDYHIKNTVDYGVLSNGMVYVEEKPRIKTQFWFGENGYDYDEKQQVAAAAEQSTTFFITENMREAGYVNIPYRYGKDVYETLAKNHEDVVMVNFDKSEKTVRLFDKLELEHSAKYEHIRSKELLDASVPVSKEDAEVILETRARAKEHFQKRLNTYLKRYGLSKVRASTYWVDR